MTNAQFYYVSVAKLSDGRWVFASKDCRSQQSNHPCTSFLDSRVKRGYDNRWQSVRTRPRIAVVVIPAKRSASRDRKKTCFPMSYDPG